jgi:hypothetical protein
MDNYWENHGIICTKYTQNNPQTVFWALTARCKISSASEVAAPENANDAIYGQIWTETRMHTVQQIIIYIYTHTHIYIYVVSTAKDYHYSDCHLLKL